MININIDKNTLYCAIALTLVFFISFVYYTKRKFDSIDKYNKLVVDKLNSYKENQDQINKNIEKTGISSKKIISKIIKYINKFRDSK